MKVELGGGEGVHPSELSNGDLAVTTYWGGVPGSAEKYLNVVVVRAGEYMVPLGTRHRFDARVLLSNLNESVRVRRLKPGDTITIGE